MFKEEEEQASRVKREGEGRGPGGNCSIRSGLSHISLDPSKTRTKFIERLSNRFKLLWSNADRGRGREGTKVMMWPWPWLPIGSTKREGGSDGSARLLGHGVGGAKRAQSSAPASSGE